jgi:hypothetical protein
LYPNVADGISVTGIVSIETPILIADLHQDIGIHENVAIAMNLGNVSVHDDIGISDVALASIIEAAYLQVVAFDNAGTGETLGKSLELADILKYETVGIRDIVTVLKNIYAAVADSIGVAEYESVVLDVISALIIPNNVEFIGVADVAAVLKSIMPSVVDGISLSDVPVMAQDIKVSVIDLVGAAEDMAALFGTNLPINQAVAIREYLDLYMETKVEAVQNIALREAHFIEMEIPGLAVFDRAALREYVAVRTEQAAGRTSITWGYKRPLIAMTNKKPDITFGTKKPEIIFAGE